jgi:TATA-binding protein-associated factor Taf7
LAISLENDLRKGMVRLDDRYLYAKVVDLPTVLECHKTIDKKSFYKTADVCQMMICREEPYPATDDESPVKNKKKDPNKVDKKFLYPHGMTPSLKNVRKRRFRKTLKKKNVELPEIEKEVKRLLRTDNEAVHVKWEIVECEEPTEAEGGRDSPAKGKKAPIKGNVLASDSLTNLDKHHIFGELSDSEDEANATLDFDADNTRLSEDSRSRFSDSNSMMQGMQSASNSQMHDFNKTEFSASMFDIGAGSSQQHDDESSDFSASRANTIRHELQQLKMSQHKMEQEIQTLNNNKLREKMQADLDNILGQIIDKEIELHGLEESLQ